MLRQDSEVSDSESKGEPQTVVDFQEAPQKDDTIMGTMDPEDKERLDCEKVVADMLQDMRDGKRLLDDTEDTPMDQALNQLNHTNFPALQRGIAKLMLKSKDKKIDVFFWAHNMAMVSILNLYLNLEVSYVGAESTT